MAGARIATGTGTATLAMPSRADGPVKSIDGMARPAMEVHPKIPDFAKLRKIIDEVYAEAKSDHGGANADYIPLRKPHHVYTHQCPWNR